PASEEAGGNLIIQSGPGLFDHVHDLLIPYALLKAPPLKGVQLTSTQAMLHQHNITLTQKELTIVNQGGTVTQKASSHRFVIALAQGKTIIARPDRETQRVRRAPPTGSETARAALRFARVPLESEP